MPEIIGNVVHQLVQTGNVKMSAIELVKDYLHQAYLDRIVNVKWTNQDYQVQQKLVKLTYHLNSFENKIRELGNDIGMLEKLKEYKNKIESDLIELEAILNMLFK